jgi:PAS domain S-box-containing protein/putative nucleotidyltransferase with HDIG domain
MQDERKTKTQLIEELQKLRGRLRELDTAGSGAEESDRSRPVVSPEYRVFLEAFEGLVYIASSDFRIVNVNTRAAEMAGPDCIGRKCYAAVYGRNEICPWCESDRVFNGEMARGEFQNPQNNHWYSVAFAPLPGDTGFFIMALVRDVTERKQALNTLMQKNSEMETVLKAFPDLYFWMDYDGTFLNYFAARPSDLLTPPADFLGKRVQEVMPPDVAKLFDKCIQRLRDGETATTMEYTLPLKEGEKYFEAKLLPLLGNQILTIVRDMTSARLAERALQEGEVRYRAIVEDQTELICRFRPDEQLTFVNEAYCRYFGRRCGETIGRSFLQLTPEPEKETVRKRLASLSPGSSVMTYDHSLVMSEGKRAWLQWTIRAIFDGDDRLLEYQAVGTDITRRIATEKELQQSMTRLTKIMDEIINAMAVTVEMRDLYTAGHQRRVAKLACAVAREMGLPEERVEGLRVAGLLHDLGKIYIPAEILSKPSKLSEPETAMMKTHPKVSYEILNGIEFPWPVAKIVLQHHELLDGTGYPAGLRGNEIIQEARILVVADVVESMATFRPYRPSLGLERALQQVSQNRGILYDAEAVDACLAVFEKGFAFD